MTNKLPKLLSLAILSMACFIIFGAPKASAASLTVNATNDTIADNGSCTLSEAILAINTTTASGAMPGECIAGDGTNDTITIPTGTIVLSTDLPQITTSMTIQGQGMGQTIIGGNNGQYTIFKNNPASTDLLALRSMTITAFKSFAIFSPQGNLTVQQLEVDGSGATFDTGPNSMSGAIAVGNPTASAINLNISDVYIHDLTADATNMFAMLIAGGTDSTDAADINATVNHVTISNLTNTGSAVGLGFAWGITNDGFGLGHLNAKASNITVAHLTSTADSAAGIVLIVVAKADQIQIASIRNVTISNLSGNQGQMLDGAAIGAIAGGLAAGADTRAILNVSNILQSSNDNNCIVGSLSGLFQQGGSDSESITSQGGNLSDDNSCSPYFTQPTDQNNLTGLAATLSALADNGGYVPTMALKQGSPAIDSGITVAGLTTDARGAARPQGSAYDSGAYESPYTKPAVVTAKPTLASSGQSLLIALGGVSVLITLGLFATKRRLAYKRV